MDKWDTKRISLVLMHAVANIRKFVKRKIAVCHQSLNNDSRIINLENL